MDLYLYVDVGSGKFQMNKIIKDEGYGNAY